VNDLIPFKFEQKNVRTLLIGGEPWFVARDAGDVLGIADVRSTLRDFPASEADVHTMHIRSKNGIEQRREMAILNEPGIYRLIFLSRKPEAVRFKTWVFTEVLPRIRRGGYITEKRFEALEAKVAELSEEKKLREENERLRRSRTRPTPEDEREILNLYRQGYSKAQIHRELFRGICSINRILEKYEDAMGQLGLFDDDEDRIAASRGKGEAV
jgi:prophage antirepressor-like protein